MASQRALLEALGPRLAAGELSAEEAVIEAVAWMEDETLFNAGRGAVLDAVGGISHEASIMSGGDGGLGSVLATRRTRHPIRAAAALLAAARRDPSHAILLTGAGADAWAAAAGLEQVEPTWFGTAQRREQWARWCARGDPAALDHQAEAWGADQAEGAVPDAEGTVGAVALDAAGGLAAATSTGGMTGAHPARRGDAGIVGAGTWADERVAASCTGIGEAFLRRAAAGRVAALLELAGVALSEAAERALGEVAGGYGKGGLIAVGADGSWAMPYDAMVMYRGVWTPGTGASVDC